MNTRARKIKRIAYRFQKRSKQQQHSDSQTMQALASRFKMAEKYLADIKDAFIASIREATANHARDTSN